MSARITLLHRIAALACIGAAVGLWPWGATAHEAQAQATRWVGADQYQRSERRYAIPDVVLTDADARPVKLRELLATTDPVMLNFVFTTCSTVCPVMVRVFSEVPAQLGDAGRNLRLVSVSIDPENDTPAQLKSYARHIGAGSRWAFLTGGVQDILAVQRAFASDRGDKMNHEPLTLMRKSADKPWVRIDGFAGPEELAREFRKMAAP